MIPFKERLINRFRNQEAFSRDYSPLYRALFEQLVDWMTAESAEQDSLVQWLVEAGQVRQTLDVTLLLAAGIHKDVLAGIPQAAGLAEYFPSVGGKREVDGEFEKALREAIEGRKESLAAFIQTANVQTNETARGLCWLLPLQAMPWERVCLVDLGASAGLNLLAEKRAFRLVEAGTVQALLDLGQAEPVQFVSRCRGNLEPLSAYQGIEIPEIVGRIGCDLLPFSLETAEGEQTLMSYVWGDQVNRLERLREGIMAFRENQAAVEPGSGQIVLHPVNLPGGLGAFLEEAVPADETPVVIYNTFMTAYLSDKGASFREKIGRWAAGCSQPVLWLQWEPVRDADIEPPDGPEYGWCGWTADLWQGQRHQRCFLAWVHPHGTEIQFEPEFSNWPPA
jgi:hypothetical protein